MTREVFRPHVVYTSLLHLKSRLHPRVSTEKLGPTWSAAPASANTCMSKDVRHTSIVQAITNTQQSRRLTKGLKIPIRLVKNGKGRNLTENYVYIYIYIYMYINII